MRILVTIPHFYRPIATPQHGSEAADPRWRLRLVTACLSALHANCGHRQTVNSWRDGLPALLPANSALGAELEIVVCTTGADHLLDRIAGPAFRQHATDAEPPLLGYECHQVLADALGRFDYFCYMEDDLVIRDPLFFHKLAWFAATFGDHALLQPNRYLQMRDGRRHYFEPITGASRNQGEPPLRAQLMGLDLVFRRPHNSHAGCFFLTEAQMRRWAARPYFMDRSSHWVGPLESAATRGIVRTFKLYKPDEPNAGFLELYDPGVSGDIARLALAMSRAADAAGGGA